MTEFTLSCPKTPEMTLEPLKNLKIKNSEKHFVCEVKVGMIKFKPLSFVKKSVFLGVLGKIKFNKVNFVKNTLFDK